MSNIEKYDPSLNVGMEDFDMATDAVMPTIKIDHKKGVFIDGLSGQEFPELDAVLLGLIKQRVLWEAEVEENSKGPLCRSYDFHQGHPDFDRFPWKSAPVFTKPASEDEVVTLPCESCPLKEWDSHPQRDTPWCSEQHTFAIMQILNEDGDMAPSLLTVQRSAIKPSRTYMTSFAKSKTPLFVCRTKVTLDHRKRGNVEYAVPKFVRGEATDPSEFPIFAENYQQIREFVQTPRIFVSDGDDDQSGAPTDAAAPAAAPAGATPPAPDEDDLPF